VLGASSWNLPGSDVGGDLTGGSVDIYVANKTILSGAVIASDIDKLKLDTGSLEYRNIKDRDRGSNFGGGGNISGGAAPKSNSQSLSVSYGFTDKRQTNFATIGEGEITVMDGKTDLSKLNRDTSISQYNTKDGGLQGGFTLDSTTVDLVADIVDAPSKAYESRKKQVLDGLRDAKDTSVLIYKEAGVVVEKTGNLLDDKGFRTNNEIKIDGLQLKLSAYEGQIANSKVDSTNGKFQIVFNSSEQAVDYILTKKQLGIPITENDAALLSQTLWQNPKDGQLAREFKEYALNNAESFQDLGIYINEKTAGVFVDRVVRNTCFINVIYMNTVLSASPDIIDSIPKSYGDMYLTAYANGLLQKDGINIRGSVNDLEVVQNFANTITGGNNYTVSGATTYGGELSTRDVYNLIPTVIGESNSIASGGRITITNENGTYGHNMMQITTDDSIKVFDTGRPDNPNGPRKHGTEYNDKIYNEKNTQSIWILTPND